MSLKHPHDGTAQTKVPEYPRADGSVAAVFSATDVAASEVVRTAEDDYRNKSKRCA